MLHASHATVATLFGSNRSRLCLPISLPLRDGCSVHEGSTQEKDSCEDGCCKSSHVLCSPKPASRTEAFHFQIDPAPCSQEGWWTTFHCRHLQAAITFLDDKGHRGRLSGSNKTTKKEDKDSVSTFLKVRPPGHGVDSRVVHKALPQKLQKNVSRRTIIRRLAAKGYTPQKKLNKNDPGHSHKLKGIAFCRKHRDKNYPKWQYHLQAVGDFKEFTWYPKELQGKFQKLRAP